MFFSFGLSTSVIFLPLDWNLKSREKSFPPQVFVKMGVSNLHQSEVLRKTVTTTRQFCELLNVHSVLQSANFKHRRAFTGAGRMETKLHTHPSDKAQSNKQQFKKMFLCLFRSSILNQRQFQESCTKRKNNKPESPR